MLFDDYAARFARGERPDAREYLARAGERVEELGTLIERFLERVPPPAPSEQAVALAQAWVAGQPPLLELRVQRRLTRDQVVDALVERLGLDCGKREKVKGYYHELEGGLLDPERVDRSVFEALAGALQARVGDLLAWRPPRTVSEVALSAAPAYYRVDPNLSLPDAPPPRRPIEEPDEIDHLFGRESLKP